MKTKQFSNLLLSAAMLLLLASSCSKKNTQGRLIPKNAGVVLHIDGKSLSAKLPWEEIKKNPAFIEAFSDSSLPIHIKTLMDNPENAGVEVASDFLFFLVKDSLGGYISFQGTVKDALKFKTFNQQMTENGTASEVDNIEYISKAPVCVGFTKEKFVYVIDAPQMSQMDVLNKRMQRDSITLPTVSGRDVGSTCKMIFALKESNTLAEEKKFTTLMGEKGDMRFWVNVEELNKDMAANPALAMMNLEKLYKGNITTGVIDFEDGKLLIKSKTYGGDEMTKLFKKYGGGKINEDMIKRLPGKDLAAVIALNFKPEGIKELLKVVGLDGLANIGLTSLGFTLDDFIKANKGDIVFGLSDFTMRPDTVKYNFEGQEENISIKSSPDFNVVFSVAIGDKDAFNKLIGAGKKLSGSALLDSGKNKFAFNSNGTYFAIGNTQQNVDQYLASANNNADFISKITGGSFGGYFNLQSLLKSFSNVASSDSTGRVVLSESLKIWDNVLIKSGGFDDGGITQTMEVNMMDKSTNSLKQLNGYLTKLASLYQAKSKKDKAAMMAFDIPAMADSTN